MNEKRFTLAYEKGNWWAVKDGDITLWKEEVIGLLNEQDETINELKAELMIRKPLYSHRELEEDNKRLHERYDFLHERYAMLLLKCKDLEDQLYGDFE